MSVAVAISSPVAADPGSGIDRTRTKQIVYGTLTLSGNYGGASTHGDTVDFTGHDQIKSDYPPTWVQVLDDQGAGNAPLTAYTFRYYAGTTQANGVLVVFQSGSEISEGGAYSGLTPSLNNAVLKFRAEFAGQV